MWEYEIARYVRTRRRTQHNSQTQKGNAMTENTELNVNMPTDSFAWHVRYSQALGYVWGREDASPHGKDRGRLPASEFAEYYAAAPSSDGPLSAQWVRFNASRGQSETV